MSEPSAEESSPEATDSPTVAELIAKLSWEQVVADGVITIEEIDVMLRAKGLDPQALDHLYD